MSTRQCRSGIRFLTGVRQEIRCNQKAYDAFYRFNSNIDMADTHDRALPSAPTGGNSLRRWKFGANGE
jgi:hypothetical protein